MEPNLALAIEDFLPVLLTFLALLWLGQMILSMHRSSGAVAAFGMALIVTGGALKAVSKLIWALFGNPVAWMDDSLFFLMAPGFACFAWALWSAQRSWFQKVSARYVWQVPVVVLLISGLGVTYATMSAGGRIWFFVALTTVVIMSTLMSGGDQLDLCCLSHINPGAQRNGPHHKCNHHIRVAKAAGQHLCRRDICLCGLAVDDKNSPIRLTHPRIAEL